MSTHEDRLKKLGSECYRILNLLEGKDPLPETILRGRVHQKVDEVRKEIYAIYHEMRGQREGIT